MAAPHTRKPLTPWQVLARIAAALVVLFLIAQLVPYGRSHANAAVTGEPAWPPGGRDLAVRACYDCHSNVTTWPWYSNIAPVSWLTQRDVNEGRGWLNFSEWNRGGSGAESAATVLSGKMPPVYYTWAHPRAALSAAEKAQLARALQALPLGQ